MKLRRPCPAIAACKFAVCRFVGSKYGATSGMVAALAGSARRPAVAPTHSNVLAIVPTCRVNPPMVNLRLVGPTSSGDPR